MEATTRTELARVEGYAGRADAPKILAARLVRRLEDQVRLHGPITDPVGWLIARGLPQRQECAPPEACTVAIACVRWCGAASVAGWC
ncbi:hypothetical protein QFZ76_009752 [Streptomyces sp. V4I2]|nr:hypothetical protein [Streptomyces sp. V4I2]